MAKEIERGSKTKKKSTAEKTSKKTSPAKKKSAAASKTPKATAAKKPPGKSKPSKKTTKTKKKATTKDLLFKKFDTWTPDPVYRVNPPQTKPEDVAAPPFISGEDASEIARKKKLLFKKFDSEPAEPKPAPYKPPVVPPSPPKSSGPLAFAMKLFLVGFALLIALVVKVSLSNRANFYLVPTQAAVEIWQGTFAPIGKERLLVLPDAQPPESVQALYTVEGVFPFVFNYYVQKADGLLEKPGIPDFEGIKAYLNTAMPYAVTDKLRQTAEARLSNIDLMVLLYKADVAVTKETRANYEAALDYLKQAAALDADGSKSDLIKKKVESIRSAMAALEPPKDDAAKPPADRQ